ncbi:carbohydrate-binding module family 20 domain-containing protein [Cryptosporangium aurantiacum]|uniref:Alpha-amylase n=1 Tax=Cryptosporangium aurantiacum TaxID=134849 RepID=A0A1M7L7G7_9ACTN|nr:carbohydrate-binding module family 20 domain-containing protein [Cryptosporangium aurantiacum]SHM73486.1 alpha-amylase [Cryptosporangium aurantiacum]
MRRIPRWPAALVLLAALVVPIREAATAAPPSGSDGRSVIVQLFEWKWTDIAAECTNVLGPKGYGGVQISPPQENIVLPQRGYPWWQRYQAISYQLESRSGTRAQFAAMVQACHSAGVKIYADAVINHTAGTWPTDTRGSAGSPFTHYNYPGIYQTQDFHHCGRNDDIANWNDAWEVHNCELVDLADLATETEYVRNRLVAYLNDLISLGVDGFRIDAAKHMPPGDIAAIKSRLNGNPYLYQEVVYGAGEPVQPSQYRGNGDLIEFRYGQQLGAAFRNGSLASLQNLGNGFEPGDSSVVFVDNHDTQRAGALTYKDGAVYTLANVFQLAWPFGTPVVMSSFSFTDNEAGPPSSSDGRTNDVTCGSGWVCEHRQGAIANMVGFRNAVGSAAVSNWWTNGSNQVGFARGDRGYVVVNRDSAALSRTFQTSLAAGTYCDVTRGEVRDGACTGPTVTVDGDGRFTATVPAMSSLAIHHLAKVSSSPSPSPSPTASASVAVNVNATVTTWYGQDVYLVGSIPALGSWNPANAKPLSSASYPVWKATLELPPSTSFQYKYVKKAPDGTITWESDPNRAATTPAGGTLALTDTWR